MTREFHPLVKRVLDGELTLGDLPLKLRPEAEEALRMLAALDRTPVTLSPGLDVRVMETVRRRAGSPATARESFRSVRGGLDLHAARRGDAAAGAGAGGRRPRGGGGGFPASPLPADC